ncbi:MAG: CocE/NonD family hydrolase, partial [Pseudomonadota bacterium]
SEGPALKKVCSLPFIGKPIASLVLVVLLSGVGIVCIEASETSNGSSNDGVEEKIAPGVIESSAYVRMPDGVLLAVQFYLPAEADSAPVPTIVEFTRYWRAMEVVPPRGERSPAIDHSLAAGYAYVVVDVRGSGASQGVRKSEFSLAEARDMPQVIDWIAAQPWSNGKVAAMGYSYPGNTAEMAALFRSPALVAAVPKFTDFDWYTSIVVPGGLKNAYITQRWGESVRRLDLNDATVFGEHVGEPTIDNPLIVGVMPVATDVDRSILKAASASHAENASLADYLQDLVYRDEYPTAADVHDSGDKAISIHNFQARFEEVSLPMYQWGSWFDAGTAAGILARFSHWDTPYKYIIGAWSHGGRHDANPYADKDAEAVPSLDDQFASVFEFLDPAMKMNEAIDLTSPELVYYTVGENVWKTTTEWPPAGQEMQRWYLHGGASLVDSNNSASLEHDEYLVDFEAGTGDSSRWSTQLGGGDVYYGNRAEADKRLLSYTSSPLDTDLEITGTARVSLRVSSTHEDGAFIAYLEDVAPDGYVRMLTEGQLRAVHRKVSAEKAAVGSEQLHSFERKDGEKLVPGEITTVSFDLLPVSALIRKGHAIRLAIAGHDKDTFVRVPETGNPTVRIYRGGQDGSWVDLPVITR